VSWKEEHPSLPKRYFLKYHEHESLETPFQEIKGEFSEWSVWVIIVFSLLLGWSVGWYGHVYYKQKYREERDLPYVPSSLLTPDERTILQKIKEQSGEMNQREIGKELNWSKSKVSAILTNLEYKEIVSREKFGRNYKVKLVKEIIGEKS